MDTLIDTQQLKTLRREKSWSQEELATVANVSLRTIQRIEKTGRCSLESKKALASAFGIDATDFDIDYEALEKRQGAARGVKWGMGGALLGMLCAYAGITWAVVAGDMGAGEAGLAYAAAAIFAGFSSAVIGFLAYRSDQQPDS
jgi:transcriptional regulator with XRE-family HTH domain